MSDKACLKQAILCYHVEIPDNNDEPYNASWNSIAGANDAPTPTGRLIYSQLGRMK